ncbi:YibE/F family protein [Lawsonibacter celer]|uniref:YibE/F family protein n=1 Tax=Lawsonibacter celer TaxID=2986526 RepID=UPI0016447314
MDSIPYLLGFAVLLATLGLLLFPGNGADYRRYETDTLRYVRGTVTQVLSQECSESALGTGQTLGVQHLEVSLSDGALVEIDNYLTETHNILARPGQHVVVCVDAPEGVEPYYTIYNYDRTSSIVCMVLVFLALMALVGRRKGVYAALALIFTVVLVVRWALPLLYSGHSPMLVGFTVVILSTVITIGLLQGFTIQGLLSMLVTLVGEIAACILFGIFSGMLHISGFQTDSAEGLLLIAQNTGLKITTLLFAATMIASLGAVMDVAVSMLSALREVAQAAARPTAGGLFTAGMNMGRDIIGTMSNTLIFAFTGGALTTMLVFYSYGVQLHQLLSSDYLAVELAQGLCGTAAVILTVPVATIVGAAVYSRHKV